MSETVSVAFEVRQVEPVDGCGKLLAVAVIALDVGGVELVLQGVGVVRAPGGGLAVRAPVWRHPGTGRWLPAVVLPDELSAAIAAEVLSLGGPG